MRETKKKKQFFLIIIMKRMFILAWELLFLFYKIIAINGSHEDALLDPHFLSIFFFFNINSNNK